MGLLVLRGRSLGGRLVGEGCFRLLVGLLAEDWCLAGLRPRVGAMRTSETMGEKFLRCGMSVLDGGEDVADDWLDRFVELDSWSVELVGGDDSFVNVLGRFAGWSRDVEEVDSFDLW
jgi:hypothetical protein